MRVLVQRVRRARVSVGAETTGEIGVGLLVLLGVSAADIEAGPGPAIRALAKKIPRLRIFDDEAGRMNLSLEDVGGQVLVVSQFTLYADARRGNRPSYVAAAAPDPAREAYEEFLSVLSAQLPGRIEAGRFGAEMNVELINWGPVTILLEADEHGVR